MNTFHESNFVNLQSRFSLLSSCSSMFDLIGVSGPNPRLFSFSTYNGSHILFESGDALFQLFRKVLQEIRMFIHKQSETQQVCFLLWRQTQPQCIVTLQSKFMTEHRDWDLPTYTGFVSAQPLKLPPNRGHAVVEHF